MLKVIDIPPLWLGLFLAVTWGIGRLIGFWPAPLVGGVLICLALTLIFVAAAQMVLARTSFVPRRDPSALVSSGVFAISRNPIYLGDALVLTGAAIFWGAWLALPLVAVFGWWITKRYILNEEARLRTGFGAAFAAWSARVPRWIWRI